MAETMGRILSSLRILCLQEPIDLIRRFIEIHWRLAARGKYSGLIIEQGLPCDDDLQTGVMVMSLYSSAEQILESADGRKGQ